MRRGFSSPVKSRSEAVFLFEKNVVLEIADAYSELKTQLLRAGCRVTAEEPPVQITVAQGSVWGVSPRSAKKLVSCRLSPLSSGTRVTCSSSLASDWKNLTIAGFVLSAVLLVLCSWIVLDLEAFITLQKASFWSWITTAGRYFDVQKAWLFVDVTVALAVFLVVTIAVEAVIVFYVHRKIDEFAKETLESLR